MKKANVAIKQVWEMGERRFKDKFKRRMLLFDYLIIKSCCVRLNEVEGENRMGESTAEIIYIRQCFGLEKCTSKFKIFEETKRGKIETIRTEGNEI